MSDPYRLDRFLQAQQDTYVRALAEIRSGCKRSHWMWYIFPQFSGLGSSANARDYAIGSAAEARAYLQHPVLGPRLHECANAALDLKTRDATEVFGVPDEMKLRSCATLFAAVSSPGSVFARLLGKYFGGAPDPRTLQILETAGGAHRAGES